MTDGFDFIERFYGSVEQEFKNFIQPRFVRREDLVGYFDAFTVGRFMLENADGLADALDVALCNDIPCRHFEELILYG